MIASLLGNVLRIYGDKAIVDVRGVGYEVYLSTESLSRFPEKGEEIFLFIFTHVREDAITLYGFFEEEEKEMFLTLRSVSGIGPKLALGILSGIKVTELCVAIRDKDVKRLTTLQGIGKKTAERMCVELKDKVGQLALAEEADEVSSSVSSSPGTVVADVISALVNLGYPDPVARQALTRVKKQLAPEVFDTLGVEDLIRETLRSMA